MITVKAQDVFLTTPYLQIGSETTIRSLELLWHTADVPAQWSVELKTKGEWVKAGNPIATRVAVANIDPHLVYRSLLSGLIPGTEFAYRVFKNGKEVFTSTAQSPKSADQPCRFVVFGDIGAGTKEAKEIANAVYKAKPDMIVVPGDIVYDYGLISDYRKKFWPIYNADKVDGVGVPLMHSIPFIGAVGNHDADSRDLDKAPDALAYFYYWDQPLNGYASKEGGSTLPVLKGTDVNKKAFFDGAGNRYPAMTNFSFNYGNAHWLVLDADNYVDWTDSALVNWVKKDLAGAQDAAWRFVNYHQPGFNSSVEHFEQQQMRLLAPVFEKGKVDVVFNGHVHNYQRSFPMHFAPAGKGTPLVGGKDNKTPRGRSVSGLWKLDKAFDGKTNTHPNGVIYIVTGAGGQDLYNPEQENDADSWQKFTDKFISTVHTFTVADINGKKLLIRQLNADGKELDAFTITKN
jgi:predicted phosphodiesterase